MGVITEKRLIRASIRDVYEYRLDFTNLPDYNHDVTQLTQTTGERGVGAAYRFRIKVLALRPWAELLVTEVVPPRRITVDIAVRPLFDVTEVCEFDEVSEGTNVVFTITVRTGLGPLAVPVDRLFTVPRGRGQLRRELDLISQQLEC
ncbi:MAG: SRPBCC family protein [Actinobacteria bacterium ATB1]|nr:SRPBCC family protein [Actinobacteria bacterium ATB1]